MEKLKQILTDLNLSELESKFYLTSLETGRASIGELAKKTGIDRSTAYFIAEELKNKGYLEEDYKKYKKQVFVKEPNYLLSVLKKQKDKFAQHEKELEELLPQLSASYAKGDLKPVLRFYKGREGLQEIRDDIFSTGCKEILLYTNQKASEQVFTASDMKDFIKKRVKSNCSIKVLAVDEPGNVKLIANDKKELRETRILPKNTYFTAETYIYGNKVAMLDFSNEIIGFIVKSSEFADAQRSIFKTLWSFLKK
ncbi:MAG: Transcriptional regulator, TrmB [uncultured bacterium]|nr:MAG: Transcriptional regulator, TrmB [uncultured bacterium]